MKVKQKLISEQGKEAMKIINKAQYALVPLVMVCNIGHASTLSEIIKGIDKKELENQITAVSHSKNSKLMGMMNALNELYNDYNDKNAYKLYEAITNLDEKGKKQADGKIKMVTTTKPAKTLNEVIALITADEKIMANGDHEDPGSYDKEAERPEGVIDTGGNPTIIRSNYKGTVIKKTMQADKANTEKGLEYLQKEIKITADVSITEAILKELHMDEMEITDTTMANLRTAIANLTTDSDATVAAMLTQIEVSKKNDLAKELKAKAKKLDKDQTAENNIIAILGEENYNKYKGKKRDAEKLKEYRSTLAKYKDITGDDIQLLDGTIYDDETVNNITELYNTNYITKLINKAAENKKSLADATKKITDAATEINKIKAEENLKLDELKKAQAKIQEDEETIKAYKKADERRAKALEINKETIEQVFGIEVGDITTLDGLMDTIVSTDADTIAQRAGYVKPGEGTTGADPTELKEKEDEIAKLKDELKTKEADIQNLKKISSAGGKSEDIQNALKVKDKKILEQENEIKRLNTLLATKGDTNPQLLKEIQNQKTELELKTKEIENLNKELTAARTTSGDAISNPDKGFIKWLVGLGGMKAAEAANARWKWMGDKNIKPITPAKAIK